MAEWLKAASEIAVTVINAMALVAIAVGTIQAFITGLIALLSRAATDRERREVWLRFARWLVIGLTFQLAADTIESSIAPSWDEIGKLVAIAAIRTFLNFFLDRAPAEVRE